MFDPKARDTLTFSEIPWTSWITCSPLEENGIYVYPDLLVHRKFRKRRCG